MTPGTTTTSQGTTNLGKEIAKRLQQLGLSRRELSKRVRISRQTLHLLEHEPGRNFANTTFEQLDIGLRWEPGTAAAFHKGNIHARVKGGKSMDAQVNAYLNAILERLAEMDIDALEREVLMLEEEALGDSAIRDAKSSRVIASKIACLQKALADVRDERPENER